MTGRLSKKERGESKSASQTKTVIVSEIVRQRERRERQIERQRGESVRVTV